MTLSRVRRIQTDRTDRLLTPLRPGQLCKSIYHPDLLIKTKLKLDDADGAVRVSVVKDLHQVAVLAESFTEQRPKSNKNWIHLADTLDREGLLLQVYVKTEFNLIP